MNPRRIVAAVLLPVTGCAVHRGPRVEPELIRSQQLADALQVGVGQMAMVPSSWDLKFSPEAARAGIGGAAIVAFVVMPNGRVNRETRTLVYVEGHTIFAKHVCDALLAARYEPAPTDPRGRIGLFPVFFSNPGGPARDKERAVFNQVNSAISGRVRRMSYDEALSWFEDRPSCSKIKIGIEPLYGGPPG